jgi:hypothetical protein
MADTAVGKSLDLALMRQCYTCVDNLGKDIEGIAQRIKKLDPSLSIDDSADLVLNFIRSSADIRRLAKEEEVSGKKGKSVWHYHFFALKQYEKIAAMHLHNTHPDLDSNEVWYNAQDGIAARIFTDDYRKVKNPGLALDDKH